MPYAIAADLLLVLHLCFIIFVAAGALLVLRWPRLALLHIPAVLWGAMIEFTGWICPLTPLENGLRRSAGEAGYAGGFIEHYVLPLIYPTGLTREIQLGLGIAVLGLNGLVYGALIVRRWRATRAGNAAR